jgi:hypothetical protein
MTNAPSYVLDESMKDVYPGVDYYRQLLTKESIPMKLNLAQFVTPLIESGALKATVIDGVNFFGATVISIDEKKNKIQLEIGDDPDTNISARLTYEGDNEVKLGAKLKFTVEGEVKFVELPSAPARQAAPAQSARRSPDRSMVDPMKAARQGRE